MISAVRVVLFCSVALFFFKVDAQSKFVIDHHNSPYYITTDTTIELNDTLIIGAGAKVIVSDGVNIQVKGRLTIQGKPDSKAEIRPLNPRIGWGEIKLEYSSDTLKIINAIIEDGRIVSLGSVNHFEDVNFINYQNLADDKAIARFITGELFINHCSIVGNNSGEGFLVHRIDDPVVMNCRFDSTPDAIEYLNCNRGLIRNCQFFDIRDDAIDLNHCIGTIIDSNLIVNVSNRGMEIGSENNGSSFDIYCYRNVMVNCTEGINFKEGSEGVIKNNTFFNNQYAITVVTGGMPIAPSRVEVINTIFHQNYRVFDIEAGSNLSINYSSSSTAFLGGSENLFTYPFFKDPTHLNFQLQENSPCINAGDTAEFDLDGTRVDIGAFHQQQSFDRSFERLNIWPNPVNREVVIRSSDTYELVKIYNQSGALVVEKMLFRNCELCSYQIDVNELKSGVYFIHLIGEKEVREKIVKI